MTSESELLPTASSAPELYAGLWLRTAAAIFDVGMMVLILFLSTLAGLFALGSLDVHDDELENIVLLGLPSVAWWFYFTLSECSSRQATYGEKKCGLMITDETGARIDFVQANIRNFGKLLTLLTLLIGFILAVRSERRQALHDRLAHTCVVRKQALEELRPGTPAPFKFRRAVVAILIVLSVVGLAYLGVVAVRTPQYYLDRSHVADALINAGTTRDRVLDYYARHGGWPPDVASAAPELAAVPLDIYTHDVTLVKCVGLDCGIVATLNTGQLDSDIAGKSLGLWTHDGGKSWYCGPSGPNPISQNYLPQSCRDKGGP